MFAGSNMGGGSSYDANTVLNMSGGSFAPGGSVISGVANVSGGDLNTFVDVFGTLNLSGTGTTGSNFEAKAGGVVNVTGGTLAGGGVYEAGSTLNMSGGSTGLGGHNINGEANISGGSITGAFDVNSGGVLNMSGGSISLDLDINTGAVGHITGGDLGGRADVKDGGILNMSGGTFGSNFDVEDGGTVNFFGTSFLVGGNAIVGLNAIGDTVVITDRDVELTGVLADGSALNYDMDLTSSSGDNAFAGSTITVTLVPEPGSLALLGLGGLAMLRRRR